MSSFSFTVGRITRLKSPTNVRQQLHWDQTTPGLGIRVTSTGQKSYIFQSSLNNKDIRTTIGNTKTWGLQGAQKRARELKVFVDKGIDPRQAIEKQILENERVSQLKKASATQVASIWIEYIEQHCNYWGDRHHRDHLLAAAKGGRQKVRGKGTTVTGPIYPLLQYKLFNITIETVTAWVITESASRPNKARQAFEMFRACWRWAHSQKRYTELIDISVVENKDLRNSLPKRKTKKFDVLEKSQLEPWFTSVMALSNPIISSYLQSLLLTGARRQELAQLRWSDVEKSAIWVKDKIDDGGRKIPLTPYLSILIHTLPKRVNNPWVFSSPSSSSGYLIEPRIAHNRALSNAGLHHVSLHGLRRSFASLAEWVEMPTGIIAQIMGHKPNATAEKHYINRPIELLATWHSKYEGWILKQANISPPNSKGHVPLVVVR